MPLTAETEHRIGEREFALMKLLAQANAFIEGSLKGEVGSGGRPDPYSCPGHRPSSVLLIDELTLRPASWQCRAISSLN